MNNMSLRLIKKNDMDKMPWKNGGGVTTEVAISPASATLAELNFDWRVSIAGVSEDGPFSKFPGYARHLVVWDGAGLVTKGAERLPMVPFTFSGDDTMDAKLISGAVKDFGVIFNPKKISCEMRVQTLAEDESYERDCEGDLFLLCARGEMRIGEFYLNPGDVVHAVGPTALIGKALDQTQIVIVELRPLS